MTERCSNCNSVLAPGEMFCVKCGKQRPRPSGQARCPKCGKPYGPNDKFCVNCGTTKPQTDDATVCSKCGKPYSTQDRFCTKCGNPKPTPKPQAQQINGCYSLKKDQLTGATNAIPTSSPKTTNRTTIKPAETQVSKQDPTSAPKQAPTPAPKQPPTPAPKQAPTPAPKQDPTPAPKQTLLDANHGKLGALACPNCGESVPAAANRCVLCGQSFAKPNDKLKKLFSQVPGSYPENGVMKRGDRILEGHIIGSVNPGFDWPILHWRDVIILVSSDATIQVLNKKGTKLATSGHTLRLSYPPCLSAGMVVLPGEREIAFWDFASRLMDRKTSAGSYRDRKLTLTGTINGPVSTDGSTFLAVPLRYPDNSCAVELFKMVGEGGINLLKRFNMPPIPSQNTMIVSVSKRCLLAGTAGTPIIRYDFDTQKRTILEQRFAQVQPDSCIPGFQVYSVALPNNKSQYFEVPSSGAESRPASAPEGIVLGFGVHYDKVYSICSSQGIEKLTIRSLNAINYNTIDLGGNTTPRYFTLPNGIIQIDAHGNFKSAGECLQNHRFQTLGEVQVCLEGKMVNPNTGQSLTNMWKTYCPQDVDGALFLLDSHNQVWCFEHPDYITAR